MRGELCPGQLCPLGVCPREFSLGRGCLTPCLPVPPPQRSAPPPTPAAALAGPKAPCSLGPEGACPCHNAHLSPDSPQPLSSLSRVHPLGNR